MAKSLTNVSSVYGPVDSWRYGKSLGVDLLMDLSTCSFNCIYCQLGFIQRITVDRKVYVPTKRVLDDFRVSDWQSADVITFSGSGEPTLALNLGEVIKEIKKIANTKIVILTNGTLFNDEQVRQDILEADVISVKLDAPREETFKIINRPANDVTLQSIISGIAKLKEDINVGACHGKPLLQIQIMLVPQNKNKADEFAPLLNEIKPDEVALNIPSRPYPSGWDIVTRGAHGKEANRIRVPTRTLKTLTLQEVNEIEKKLKKLTRLKIISVYAL